MKRRPIVFICALFFLGISFSLKAQTSVEKLAQKITENDATDAEKANTIFTWITENISYDVKGYQKLKFKAYTPQQIKSRKKALCGDYAKLTKAMLEAVGVKSLVINGYDNFFYYYPNEPLYMNMHAWNMVKIDSVWYHSDLTWASGSVRTKKRPFRMFLKNTMGIPYLNSKLEYVKDVKPQFLLSNSSLFENQDHLPANPLFQINKKEISVDEFIKGTTYERTTNNENRQDIDKYLNYSQTFQDYVSGDLAYKYNPKNNRIKAYSEYAYFRDNASVPKVFIKTEYSKKQLGDFKKRLGSSNKYYKLHIGDLKKMHAFRKKDNLNYHNAAGKQIKKLETAVSDQYSNYERVLKSISVQSVNNNKTNEKLIADYKKILKGANPKFKAAIDTSFRDSMQLVVKQLESEIEKLNNRLIQLSDSTFEHVYAQRRYLLLQKQIVGSINNGLYNEVALDTLTNYMVEVMKELDRGEVLFNAQMKKMNTVSKSKIKLLSELKKAKLDHDKYNNGTYVTQMDIKINMNHENIQQNTNYNNWAKAIAKQINYNNKLLRKFEKRNKTITKAENYRNDKVDRRNDYWMNSFQGFAEEAIAHNDNYIKLIDQKIKQR